MYSASTVAAAIVQKAIDEGNPVTQMKLQKMAYFAQGYNLARKEEKLFKEEIQAWKFGPVVPVIYNDYKLYGNNPITDFEKALNSYSLLGKCHIDFDDDLRDALDYTWKATGNLTAFSLSNWTHLPGSPWQQVYNPRDQSIIIDSERIKEYFKEIIY
ncbi:Uncharacterized phage-associated protein [Mucilaginibacter lappiensis]|uniref:Phage-associated protein n=1 Tax=Mucilaginibacter lappiensis TaxID=354630 RepID=A0ABR6PIZ3_9SPHI|nr:type II toxin-antitoxin system antitoxin SocA domain-containing protein [Mucilaginibacter lappiensis]MBB6109747.1 putative phage-associated protein [Mucilaginibacter lappiensis]SIR14070.1 Uncharacterized phage-associated protein [Mucilaginibacter lappiensis]